MTSGKTLSDFLSSVDPVTKQYYRGTFTLDQLDNGELDDLVDMNTKNIFVLNKNQHYFGIFASNYNSRSAFIDSVRVYPAGYNDEELDGFLQTFCTDDYDTLPFRVQSPHSDLCAAYTVYFFHQLCNQLTLEAACKPFRPSLYNQNDKLLMEWYADTFSATAASALFPKH